MDCKRLAIGFIASLITPCLVACAPTKNLQDTKPPDILRWVKPDSDPIKILSEAPAECLSTFDLKNPEVLLGRTAFRSPFLLGGQATRRGLTCQACHSQGQTHENFFILGLSETPGTADVTNFHFSDSLGDEVFNPSPIPSLSDDIHGVDHDPQKLDLENLVVKLITKEFTGPTPEPEVLSGLLAYIRALDDEKCGAKSVLKAEELLDYKLSVISDGFDHLTELKTDYAPKVRGFMLAGLRHEIGQLYSRYPESEKLQIRLQELGQSLNLRKGDLANERLAEAKQEWSALKLDLKDHYSKSLYDPHYISSWAARY